ncbi:protein naked cuticle [Anastrepha ludens]|uniref:protein naked cuticle n=1 Tax=Anastrepha ludens TaxID=28586 RepID=UPI0023B0B2D1|nr:protein naked cuticle [Anastrepha ludens]
MVSAQLHHSVQLLKAGNAVQECTTDSEELMYHQVRASSSCSAPPDLLMVSDRENNIPLRSPVVNIITTTTPTATGHHSSGAVGSSSVQKHHQQQQHAAGQQQQQQAHKEHHQHQHYSKEGSSKQHLKLSGKSAASKFVSAQQQLAVTNQQQQHQQQQDEIDGQQQTSHQRHSSHQHGKEERIRLEEFTCDVSVEGGKSTQPLQFSFTFYDLDGHHGKITKDDIVGIVYTIYESIGKSVVVPHCGSKTINVRLTVSPEGKSKSATAAAAAAAVVGGGGGGKLKKMANGAGTGTGVGILETATKANAGHGHGHTRRQHRYRPRKLIKSDDEDDDSNSDKEKETAATSSALAANNLGTTPAMAAVAGVGGKSKSHSSASKYNKVKSSAAATVAVAEQHQLWYQQQQEAANATEQQHQQQQTPTNLDASAAANCPHENLYENMTATNLKCCTKDALLKMEDCRGCETGVTSAPITTGYGRSPTDVYMRQASTRVKMLRKARKQKFQDHCHETRQRSLSVGSEACWHNRHSQQQQQQQQQGKLEQLQPPQQQQQLGDVVDGVQLRNPHKNTAASSNVLAQRQRNSAECWKTALNRNDLMSIIRESMEKNRLCFQMSGKPQANVSPIRQPQHQHQQLHSQQPQQQQQQQQQQQHQNQQRQRSNTVSKIPTLITNHSNAIINHSSSCIMPNNSNNNNNHHSPSHNNSNSSSHSHSSNHTNNNSSEINLHDISTTNNSNNTIQYHPQPHIPIYHQQMAINPAVLAAQSGMQHGHHNKMNLCGYDSFLHATICGGGTSHSPPPGSTGPTAVATLVPQIVSLNQPTQHSSSNNANQQQLIATVQPIMTAVPSSNSTPAKVFLNSTTHQIKTSKILRSGSYSQQQAHQSITAHNSPQYHGYQRLSSSNTHHSGGHHHHHQSQQQLQQQCANKLAILNLSSVQLERSPAVDHIEKWMKNNTAKHQRKDGAAKYADNSLYAKLSEKLQESALNTQQHNHRENMQRRKHKTAHKVRSAPLVQKLATAQQQQQLKNTYAANGIHSSSSNTSIGNYTALIPIHGDPTECENLIAPTTTDDEAVNEAPTAEVFLARKSESAVKVTNTANPVMNGAAEANKENNVTTAKLVDLSDDTELAGIEAHEQEVTIRVSDTAEANEVDEEEREEDEEEEEVETEGSGGGNASAANTSSGASSLIHRYVHEHIHHHYHHFEEKDE